MTELKISYDRRGYDRTAVNYNGYSYNGEDMGDNTRIFTITAPDGSVGNFILTPVDKTDPVGYHPLDLRGEEYLDHKDFALCLWFPHPDSPSGIGQGWKKDYSDIVFDPDGDGFENDFKGDLKAVFPFITQKIKNLTASYNFDKKLGLLSS